MKNKLVAGIGINDSDYPVVRYAYVNGKRKITWKCPFYEKWKNMLDRVSSHQNYGDSGVSPEWVRFSGFKCWMEGISWDGLELDKDLLVKGNKVYGPDTCVFVPHWINSLLLDRGKARGNFPLGVSYQQTSKSTKIQGPSKKNFLAQITKKGYLGVFHTIEEAHRAWQKEKIIQIQESVNLWAKEQSFNTKVADSLLSVAWKIQLDVLEGKETKLK